MDKFDVLMIGNPNVGKSSLFNILTKEKEHTGNWIGKTVTSKKGKYIYNKVIYNIYDLPGIYSLNAYSEEEKVTTDYILFNNYDLILVIIDVLQIERNLNLLLQILEFTNKVVLVINQVDLIKTEEINIDFEELSKILKIDVVETSAFNKTGIEQLKKVIAKNKSKSKTNNFLIEYNNELEDNIKYLSEKIDNNKKRWISLKILENSYEFINKIISYYNLDKKIKNYVFLDKYKVDTIINNQYNILINNIVKKCIKRNKKNNITLKIDRIITSKIYGIPIMLLFISLIFYLTIIFANYPSNILFNLFRDLERILLNFLKMIHLPNSIIDLLINGSYRTTTWVTSVMLPPMAIFFPLFSILEEVGYLPRVAFNLDGVFNKCHSCGKQALTMIMGFGCNVVGVINSKIINSKRLRMISIITNSFIPCNGRFPMMLTIISIFFMGSNIKKISILFLFILLSFSISLIVTKLLSRKDNSSFIIELPRYKKINIRNTLKNSFLDKTLKVLGRSVKVSCISGIIIYILANTNINNHSILFMLNNFFDPFGKIIGLDGVIITSFILALPANEIVIPIMLMSYLNTGVIIEMNNIFQLKELLQNNGWTIITAINFLIITLFHFPCSTTLITILKETKSKKILLLSFVLPLIIGIIMTFITKNILSIII